MARPKLFLVFELIFFALLAQRITVALLYWEEVLQNDLPMRQALFFLSGTTIWILVIACLAPLVSRKRSKVAMWVLILMTLVQVADIIFRLSLTSLFSPKYLTLSIKTAVQITAVGLLFLPSARRWFANKEEPTGLTKTFL